MKLRDPGPSLTLTDIARFEEEIGGRLPNDYTRFLIAANGGWTDPPVGFFWNEKLNKVPTFDTLLPTFDSGLRLCLRNLRELGIDGYLPITSTQNQEDICLSFVENIGSIWLALPRYERDVRVIVELVPLAESFTEFCGSLVEIPDPYCAIENLGKDGSPAKLDEYLAANNSIDALGKNDLTILCEAIKYGNLAMIEACIQRGASLSNALHIAVSNQRPDIVKRVIEAGANINERDRWGDRPLKHVAGICLPGKDGVQNRAMQELLLRLGADPSDAQVP